MYRTKTNRVKKKERTTRGDLGRKRIAKAYKLTNKMPRKMRGFLEGDQPEGKEKNSHLDRTSIAT